MRRSSARSPPGRGRRPAGTARRSHGSWSAACAARARRRRRTGASAPRRPARARPPAPPAPGRRASIWASIAFSARRQPAQLGRRRPTPGTRRVRSPPAIAAAVRSISRSGCRLVRTIATPTAGQRRPAPPAPTNSSDRRPARPTALSTSEVLADQRGIRRRARGDQHPPAVLAASRASPCTACPSCGDRPASAAGDGRQRPRAARCRTTPRLVSAARPGDAEAT